MKTTANLLFFAVTLVVQAKLMADTPLPPPATKEVWSPNKKFCVVMEPDPATTTIFRVEGEGKRTKSWAMPGWFRAAHLADDGEHLIVGHGGINLLPLNVTKDEPMIRFYNKEKPINTVTLGELLKDQSSLKRTASHYLWGSYLGLDEKGRYVVKTVEERTLAFDVTTGKPPSKNDHSEAEKQAVATAESWLALTDDGKYSESWDVAADYLKNAVTKDDFAKSLNAARKPLGKLKSREVK